MLCGLWPLLTPNTYEMGLFWVDVLYCMLLLTKKRKGVTVTFKMTYLEFLLLHQYSRWCYETQATGKQTLLVSNTGTVHVKEKPVQELQGREQANMMRVECSVPASWSGSKRKWI